MDYSKHYNLLIEKAKNRVIDVYLENHHIIPRCMGGLDDLDNIVALTPEEHYLAHQLLVKMYPNNKNLAYAANMMCTNRPSNKLYGWIRRRISVNMQINNPNKNGKSNRKRKGKYSISEQAKQNISKGMIANKTNFGSKNGMFGKKAWEHGRATAKTIEMWSRANFYYEWWKKSGFEIGGQNSMAKAFYEQYTGTHGNLIKYFRAGWIPTEDPDWVNFFKQ